jgi:hypothetical protein
MATTSGIAPKHKSTSVHLPLVGEVRGLLVPIRSSTGDADMFSMPTSGIRWFCPIVCMLPLVGAIQKSTLHANKKLHKLISGTTKYWYD